jgi:hypothetical protein
LITIKFRPVSASGAAARATVKRLLGEEKAKLAEIPAHETAK